MASEPRIRSGSESGAALLTVLLLVAILAVIAAVALDRLVLASRMTRNIVSADQGRAYLIAAEQVAGKHLDKLNILHADRTTLQGDWMATPQTMIVPGGSVIAEARDAGNCFNLNSLVERAQPVPGVQGRPYVARRLAVDQFSSLMQLLGIEHAQADQIAVSAADWIDTDSVPGPGGAEDDYYLSLKPGYRTPNALMADATELRMVNAVTPDVYQRIRPWICALPVTTLSPINVNTLLPGQAVLLAMLAPGKLSIESARQLLAQRPVDGYGSTTDFWKQGPLASITVPQQVTDQVQQKTRWFEVAFSVDLGGDKVEDTVLYDAGMGPAHVVRRQWSGNND